MITWEMQNMFFQIMTIHRLECGRKQNDTFGKHQSITILYWRQYLKSFFLVIKPNALADIALEMLREISRSEDVLEVAIEYPGNITSTESSHVQSDLCPLRNIDYAY
jgi:hypothetical protein